MLDGIGTAVGTMIVVLVILYLTYLFTKTVGRGMGGRNQSSYIKLLDQLMIAQDRSIAVVKIGNRCFLIGIASSEITYLTELQEEDLVDLTLSSSDTEKMDFKQLMTKLGNRKR